MKPPLVLRLIRLKEATGQTVCLLTNQGPERLSDALAARIYKLRWGIEVMWRDLKQTMSHHKTLGTSPGRVQAELDWALAGLWMLQLISVERMIASKQLPHRYSPASSLRVLRCAMGGKRRKRRTLVMELTQAVKDTYCRKGSKKARHYPKKEAAASARRTPAAHGLARGKRLRSGFSSNRRLNWLRRSMAPNWVERHSQGAVHFRFPMLTSSPFLSHRPPYERHQGGSIPPRVRSPGVLSSRSRSAR